MRKSSLSAVSIPEQAKIIQSVSADMNFSSYEYMNTGTLIKWSSGAIATGYPSAILMFIDAGSPLPWVAGVLSAIMGLIGFGGFFTGSGKAMGKNFSDKSAPVAIGEWKNQKTTQKSNLHVSHGIKVSQRSHGNLLLALLNPARLFRKVLLRETIWYDPALDIFTRERSYMGPFNWVETCETLAGRRRTFVTAVKSVEEEGKE